MNEMFRRFEFIQAYIDDLFCGFEFIWEYINEVLTTTKGDWYDHLDKLELTLQNLKYNGPKCNIENSFFGKTIWNI